MLFCKEIEGLHGDDFQGSINEHHIFAEVLFGNNHGNTCQKCLVTGVINFECDYSKQRDVLLCSNTENSALISQADSCNVQEDSRENSGPGFYSEGCASLTRNGHDGNGKRIKLSVDELSYSRPYSGKILYSSAPLKGVVSSISQTASPSVSPSVCHAVTCRLVESSSAGVTSSCYLVKCHAETNSGSSMGDKDVSKSRLPNVDGNDEKEVGASKAIASPVSQESSVTKLLGTGPSANVGNKSGSLRCAKEKIKPSKTYELSVAKISPNRDFLKDPRPLLRNHVQNLLRAAGWEIGRRKREDNINGEFIYLSPKAVRPIREFRRAWNSCGQSLFAEINIVVQEDGKLWTDMNDFWSDLSNTLIKIEELNNKETTAAALAQWWCLLDPFANMVFIDKKLGTLKAGKVVRARRCLVSDASMEDDAIVALNNVDSFGNKSGRYSLDGLHDSSLVRESALTNSEGNYCVCNEKCGNGISENFYQLQTGTGKAVKGESVYLWGEKCTHSRATVSRTGAQREEISGNKKSEQDLTSLQALGTCAICDHSSSCLFEVPITSGNSSVVLEGSETVFSHQDYNTNSPNGDRYRSDYGEELTLEVGKILSVGGGKSISGEITDKVENQLKGSLDNHLNCRNGLVHSNNQNITNVPFSTCLGSFSSRPSLVEDTHLEDVDDREAMQLSGVIWKVSGRHSIESEFGINGSSSVADAILRRKGHKKSKKITEIKLATVCQSDKLLMYSNKSEGCDIEGNCFRSDSEEIQECFIATDIKNDRSCKKSFTCSSQCQTGKKESRFRKSNHSSCSSKNLNQFFHDREHSKELKFENISDEAPRRTRNKSLDPETSRQGINSEKPETQSENGQNRSIACQLKDDDLLISAVIENKTFRSATKQSTCKLKSYKSKALRKHKSQKGSCRLLPRSLSKGGKHIEGRWSIFGARTVLSWLLDSGVVSLDEVIQYRNPKDDAVIKYGLVTRDGILCKCCGKVLSVSEFKIHAGFKLNRPCLNLVMESGKSFTLCQLEAWSAEYKARKSAIRAVHVDDMDQNDDSCGLCGDGGELICCDNCPSTFHQTCLCAQDLPEGSWYCSLCSCRICGDVVNDKETSTSPGALKCSQCEHKYHEACLKEKGTYREVAFGTWFCGENCREVYVGLQSRIGLVNLLSDGFSWTLLRCIHGDQRVHSAQRFVALKAECNTKLAVALTIMEECFISMVDPRTGIHMIPHVLYNWGSQFARLNYHGFYTVVLEKDDVLMSVASIRIHGVTVAEMPLIATCSKYRRQGMCRRLMNSIEEMLTSFKVEKLVVSAIPSLVETWTVGFGFKPLEDTERKSLSNINLMVFPGTVWLKKPIYQAGSGNASSSNIDNPTETGVFSQGGRTMAQSINYGWSPPKEVSAVQTEITHREEGNNEQDGALQEHFPKMSCEASTVGGTQPKSEMACLVESVVMYDEKKLFLDEQLLKADMLQNNEK